MNALLAKSNLFIRTWYHQLDFLDDETEKSAPKKLQPYQTSSSVWFCPFSDLGALTIRHPTPSPAAWQEVERRPRRKAHSRSRYSVQLQCKEGFVWALRGGYSVVSRWTALLLPRRKYTQGSAVKLGFTSSRARDDRLFYSLRINGHCIRILFSSPFRNPWPQDQNINA